MMSESKPPFESWAIVEVMGHSRYAGFVTERSIGGTSFLQVEVPEVDGAPGFTKILGATAIFAITPVEEAIARAEAQFSASREFRKLNLPAEIHEAIREGRKVLASRRLPESTNEICSDCGYAPCECPRKEDYTDSEDDL
jgi:hypothetical protein